MTILCYLKMIKEKQEEEQLKAMEEEEEDDEEEEEEVKDEDEDEEEAEYRERNRQLLKKKKKAKAKSNKYKEPKRLRTLIILPASLLLQWQGEIENRFERNAFKFHVYHDANRKKYASRLHDNDIVFTTYEIASRELCTVDKEGNDLPTVSLIF